ncbi:MAG: SAM-dependent methyltransferase [Planctomycetota bacterium]|nr:MAG: SAM-dependent methyltransferase [Planctomycetota bacterium]
MYQNTVAIKTKTRDEIAQAYSSDPWWYDLRGFMILSFSYRETLWSQISFFGSNFGEVHLEAAIGTGTLLDIILKYKKLMRRSIPRIIGFDYAERMLNGARKRFKNNKSVELIRADVAKLPYKENYFDTINIANAIHCFPDVASALKEIHRVLKADGTLALNTLLYPDSKNPLNIISIKINNWGIKKGILFTPYHSDEIKTLLDIIGFRIVYEKRKGNVLNVVAKKKVEVGV